MQNKNIILVIFNYMIRNILRSFCTKKPTENITLSQVMNKVEEVAMSEQQMQKQVELRMRELEKVHRQTQQIIDSKIKFPIKLCGTSDRYESKFAYLPGRIMSYYKIPTSRVNDYLLKMFKASLYAIADRNTEYMTEYWESGLMEKALLAIDEARSKNLKIQVEKDSNYLEEIPESCQIIDSIMLRGLSLNRAENKAPNQYVKFSEADELGLITYTPKYLTENNENFINPKSNKTVFQGYDKMLLRVLVRIKSPLRLNIPEFGVPKDVYTWEHLCVMENQMVPLKPLESNYKLQTLMQWLGKYRFGPWRIVDLDNFMLGNSPFCKHHPENQQIDPIFKNTKLDKSYHIDIRMI